MCESKSRCFYNGTVSLLWLAGADECTVTVNKRTRSQSIPERRTDDRWFIIAQCSHSCELSFSIMLHFFATLDHARMVCWAG